MRWVINRPYTQIFPCQFESQPLLCCLTISPYGSSMSWKPWIIFPFTMLKPINNCSRWLSRTFLILSSIQHISNHFVEGASLSDIILSMSSIYGQLFLLSFSFLIPCLKYKIKLSVDIVSKLYLYYFVQCTKFYCSTVHLY